MTTESTVTLNKDQKMILINAINLYLEKAELSPEEMSELRELKKKLVD